MNAESGGGVLRHCAIGAELPDEEPGGRFVLPVLREKGCEELSAVLRAVRSVGEHVV